MYSVLGQEHMTKTALTFYLAYKDQNFVNPFPKLSFVTEDSNNTLNTISKI